MMFNMKFSFAIVFILSSGVIPTSSMRDLKVESMIADKSPKSKKSSKSKSKIRRTNCKTIHDLIQETFTGYDANNHYYDITLGPGKSYKQTSSRQKEYLVGSFDKIVENKVLYTGGVSTFCGKSREGTVELVEDPLVKHGFEVTFSEPEKCVYKAIITVPKVCVQI